MRSPDGSPGTTITLGTAFGSLSPPSGSRLFTSPLKRGLLTQILHELELAFDAGIDAEEVNAARLSVVPQFSQQPLGARVVRNVQPQRIEERRAVPPTAAQEPMARAHVERLGRAGGTNLVAAGWSAGCARRTDRPAPEDPSVRRGSRPWGRGRYRRVPGVWTSGTPLGQRPTILAASHTMKPASGIPLRRMDSSRRKRQKPATSCSSLR